MADLSGLDSDLSFDSVDTDLHLNNFNPLANDFDFSEFLNLDSSDMSMTSYSDEALADRDSSIDAAAIDTQIAATMKHASTLASASTPAPAALTTETEVADQVVPNPEISSTSITTEAATDKAAREGAATTGTANLQKISLSSPTAAQELPSTPLNNPPAPVNLQATTPQEQLLTPVSTQVTELTLSVPPNNFQTTEQSAFLPLPSSEEVLDYEPGNFDFEKELSAWFPSTISPEPEAQSGRLDELDIFLPIVAGPSGISQSASSDRPTSIENYNMSTNMNMNMDISNTNITAQTSTVAEAPQTSTNAQVQPQAAEAPAPLPLPSEAFADTSVYTDQNHGRPLSSAAVQQDQQHDAQPATEEFIQAFGSGRIPRTPLIYTTQTNDLNNAILCTPLVSPFASFGASPFESSPASTLSYPQVATPQQPVEVDWVSVGKMPLQDHELAVIGTPIPAKQVTPAIKARQNKGKCRAQFSAPRQAPPQVAAGKRKRSGTDPQEPAAKHIRTNSAPESNVSQYRMAPLVQGSVNTDGCGNPCHSSYEQPQKFLPVGRHSQGPVSGANGRLVMHHWQQQQPQQYYQLPQESNFLDTVFPSEIPAEIIAMQEATMGIAHNSHGPPQMDHDQGYVHQGQQYMHHQQPYIRPQQSDMRQQQPALHHQRPSTYRAEQHVVYDQPQHMHNQQGNMYHEQSYMYQEQPMVHDHQQYMPVQQQQAQMQMQMQPQHNREGRLPQPQSARLGTSKKAATRRPAPSVTKPSANTQACPVLPPPTMNAVIEATQAGWRQDLFNANGPIHPDGYTAAYDFMVPAPTGMLMMTEDYEKMGEKHRQQQLAAEATGS